MMAKSKSSKSGQFLNKELKCELGFNHVPFKLSQKQLEFMDVIENPDNKIIFIHGCSGVSKTWISVYSMLKTFEKDKKDKILYLRSLAESSGKSIGALKGTLEEKFEPFAAPFYDKLEEILDDQSRIYMTGNQKAKAAPINFLRGADWKNSLVIFDEAQNATVQELTTVLTRLGKDSKLIVCGDTMQSDIRSSGFANMCTLFNDEESASHGIQVLEFDKYDIVRSEVLSFIISRLEGSSV